MKNNNIKLILFYIILCFILNVSISVFAENNTYEYNEIFKLDEEKSSVKEGDNKLNIDSTIKLVFTKNISDDKETIEINKSLVTITDENNNLIDIEVDIKDYNTTGNPEDKNSIYIKPLTPLKIGKKYIIIIDENLKTNEAYLEKQFPISLSFIAFSEDEDQSSEEENIIDKDTLIEKIKEALLLKYNINLEELENDRIIISIINQEGIEIKYIYIGTIEEVQEIIKKLDTEINKLEEPEQESKPEPEYKPENKPMVTPKPKPEYKPENYPNVGNNDNEYIDSEQEQEEDIDKIDNGNNNDGKGYDEEDLNYGSNEENKEENKSEEIEDTDDYEFNNNIGVALMLCFFIGASTYMIYFS